MPPTPVRNEKMSTMVSMTYLTLESSTKRDCPHQVWFKEDIFKPFSSKRNSTLNDVVLVTGCRWYMEAFRREIGFCEPVQLNGEPFTINGWTSTFDGHKDTYNDFHWHWYLRRYRLRCQTESRIYLIQRQQSLGKEVVDSETETTTTSWQYDLNFKHLKSSKHMMGWLVHGNGWISWFQKLGCIKHVAPSLWVIHPWYEGKYGEDFYVFLGEFGVWQGSQSSYLEETKNALTLSMFVSQNLFWSQSNWRKLWPSWHFHR